MSAINSTNFFRWFTGDSVDETTAFPRLGVIDAKTYLPSLVSGEIFGFYLNADIPFYDADDFSNLVLRIIDNNGNVQASLSNVLIKVPLALGYRLYCSIALPNLISGQYQFAIYNSATSINKCISNYFQVISGADADLYTVAVQWQNSRDAYFYDWSQVPSEFFCALRLNISLSSFQPEETIDQTKAVSTGLRRNNNYDTDLPYKLNTYYFDDGAHLACIPMFKADNLIINGKNYIQKTAYVPNARPNSKISIGEIELYDQYFSTINKFGQLPQQVTPNNQIANSYTILNNSVDNLAVSIGVNGGGVTPVDTIAPNGIYQVPITSLDNTKYITLSYADSDPLTSMAAIFVTLANGNYTRQTSNISPGTPFGNVAYNDLLGANYIMVFGTVNAVRTTAWRGQAASRVCVISGGVNTGNSIYNTLEQYYTDTNTATGTTKPNVNTDPDYISPAADANCAVTSYQTLTLVTADTLNALCAASAITTAYAGVNAVLYTVGTKLFSNTGLSTPLPNGYYRDGDSKLVIVSGQVANIFYCSYS